MARRRPSARSRGRLGSGSLGEALEPDPPAAGRADGIAHLLPAIAVAVQLAVFEVDARASVTFGREANLNLAGPLEVGLDLPLEVDVPAEHEQRRRLVCENTRPLALASVGSAVVDAAAGTRLDNHLCERRVEDVMVRRPPARH